MTRSILFSLMFLLVSAAPVMAADQASELTGKNLIDGEVVTVGDLFTHAGGNAGHVLAPAPAIGKKLVLSHDELAQVADAFRLDWPARDNPDLAIVLERNAVQIEPDMIVNALLSSDLRHKTGDKAEFTLNGLSNGIMVEGREMPEMVISNTSFDPDSEKFSASLQLRRQGETVKEIRIEGLAAIMVRLPVAKFAMPSGQALTENDLMEISLPKRQLRGDMITDKSGLVGMVARRSLQAGQVIGKSDIVPPLMVKRNDLVTIIYRSGAIQLSSKARSMGAGAIGDHLLFMNMTSKKSFEAKVTGPQLAEVNLDG